MIAEQLAVEPSKSDTYQFSGDPDASWADSAREIMARARLSCRVTNIRGADNPTPAKRPANSWFDCSKISVFASSLHDWKAATKQAIKELGAIA